MAALDLSLTLGLPTASAPISDQGFGSGASAGNASETEYSTTLTSNAIIEFKRSISVTETRQQALPPTPREMKKYYLINVSITKGKVGGSKKRKTTDTERRVPKPEDRHRTCSNINCRVSATPMWRTGPFGPKSLCNACGIKYRKLKLKEKQGEGASGEGSSNAS